jgi:hypothetical protein
MVAPGRRGMVTPQEVVCAKFEASFASALGLEVDNLVLQVKNENWGGEFVAKDRVADKSVIKVLRRQQGPSDHKVYLQDKKIRLSRHTVLVHNCQSAWINHVWVHSTVGNSIFHHQENIRNTVHIRHISTCFHRI